MLDQHWAAFREDVFAIEQVAELQRIEAGGDLREISIPTDKAGVLMRKRLKQLADLES